MVENSSEIPETTGPNGDVQEATIGTHFASTKPSLGAGVAGCNIVAPGIVLCDSFQLQKRVGKGGMGEVWKAYDRSSDREVIVKMLSEEFRYSEEAADETARAFKKVHRLQHQNICPVYGLFTAPTHGMFLVMKYINGVPLNIYRRRVIEEFGMFKFSEGIKILWDVARGLDYAHSKKVIHRDVKPRNILISREDGVQIIDFGLAQEFYTGTVNINEVRMEVSGTRPYMAPEQWQGKYQNAQTDQYSLAVTAYELFCGYFPLFNKDTNLMREAVLNDEPDPIEELPDYVNKALLKALSKHWKQRFDSCKEFVRALAINPEAVDAEDSNTSGLLKSYDTSSISPSSSKGGISLRGWKPLISQSHISLTAPEAVIIRPVADKECPSVKSKSRQHKISSRYFPDTGTLSSVKKFLNSRKKPIYLCSSIAVIIGGILLSLAGITAKPSSKVDNKVNGINTKVIRLKQEPAGATSDNNFLEGGGERKSSPYF